jgi:hypothetical protein
VRKPAHPCEADPPELPRLADLLRLVPELEEAGHAREAMNAASEAFSLAPESCAARLLLTGSARVTLADLLGCPVDGGLLRAVRARLVDRAPGLLGFAQDLYHLAGVHDLVVHRHEDSFDVARIMRALDRLGLKLLAFSLPTEALRLRYRRQHPDDPRFRDTAAWARIEKSSPLMFTGMYGLWCRRRKEHRT